MDDLITWLRAQIRTDEMLAKTAFGDHNDAGPEWTEIWSGTVDTGDEHIACFDSGLSRHIVNVDPARVLREVEAKRRTIEWCVEVIGDRDLSRYGEFGLLKDDPDALAVTLAVEQLKITGLPFSDRPGYREEWRP